MNKYEEIIEEGVSKCGWDESTQHTLVLDFLETHCADKLALFKEVIGGIVADEESGTF